MLHQWMIDTELLHTVGLVRVLFRKGSYQTCTVPGIYASQYSDSSLQAPPSVVVALQGEKPICPKIRRPPYSFKTTTAPVGLCFCVEPEQRSAHISFMQHHRNRLQTSRNAHSLAQMLTRPIQGACVSLRSLEVFRARSIRVSAQLYTGHNYETTKQESQHPVNCSPRVQHAQAPREGRREEQTRSQPKGDNQTG